PGSSVEPTFAATWTSTWSPGSSVTTSGAKRTSGFAVRPPGPLKADTVTGPEPFASVVFSTMKTPSPLLPAWASITIVLSDSGAGAAGAGAVEGAGAGGSAVRLRLMSAGATASTRSRVRR